MFNRLIPKEDTKKFCDRDRAQDPAGGAYSTTLHRTPSWIKQILLLMPVERSSGRGKEWKEGGYSPQPPMKIPGYATVPACRHDAMSVENKTVQQKVVVA